ncbi:MFS transporter small subunit [Methylomonas koyamae]
MNDSQDSKPSSRLAVALFWLYVLLPLSWGVWSTVKKALALFA